MAKDDEVFVPFPGRTVERGRGCWNCKHFDNSARVKQHYLALRTAEVAKAGIDLFAGHPAPYVAPSEALRAHKVGEDTVAAEAVQRERSRRKAFDSLAEKGVIGICTAGKAHGDFVMFGYLCDFWSGVQGSSVATAGHELDLLPEELKDKLGDPE